MPRIERISLRIYVRKIAAFFLEGFGTAMAIGAERLKQTESKRVVITSMRLDMIDRRGWRQHAALQAKTA
jgi:hypothetical protein